MSRLVLIDGNAILHRAYHALPPSLTNGKGEPTNAVYGFVAMLLRVIENLKPTHLAVAFDRPKPTFRKKLFKDYQAQRPEMEAALSGQIEKVHNVVEAFKIPIYELDGFEADDVIGTIAAKFQKEKNTEIVIVTGDRDLLQLVNDQVKLFMPVKGLSEGKLFGVIEAEERMGVAPMQIVDLKALMGDASDNYPGVAGIGPKTAAGLLKKYGTLEQVYNHLEKITPNVTEKLKKYRDNAFLSQKLATVVTDAPIDFSSDKTQLPDDLLTKEVIETFGELGFRTLLTRLSKMTNKSNPEFAKEKIVDKKQMELF
ncbi:MAG: 5'-3' exonuclease H3TH domain-containing protein [Patescibacteria group bacterium]